MTQRQDDDRIEFSREVAPQGLNGADILAVLAVLALLSAVGLLTFVLTTALAN